MANDSDEFLTYVIHNPGTFKPLKVYTLISFYSIYIFMYLVVSIASFIITDTEIKCDVYFVMIYCNVSTWILTALSQDYFRRKHYYMKLRGYVSFYKEVQPFMILIFLVASLGNILMIAFIASFLVLNRHKLLTCETENFLTSPANQLATIVFFETLTILYLMYKYGRKVYLFNRTQPVSETNQPEIPGLYVGARPREQEISDLINKQADIIDYYREINKKLVEKLALKKREPSASSTLVINDV